VGVCAFVYLCIVLKVKCSSQRDWIWTCNCECFSRTRHRASFLHTMVSLHLPPFPHILSILHSRMKKAICIVLSMSLGPFWMYSIGTSAMLLK